MKEMSESAVRHLAKRHGFIVRKSRTRNPDAPDYGGYILINHLVLGGAGWFYSAELEDIADWLTAPECADARELWSA
jgi:hypothetical protein